MTIETRITLNCAEEHTNSGKNITGAVISDYCVVDTETTGLSKSDEIIEISAIRIRGDVEVARFTSLMHTDIELDDYVSDLTGITDDMLKSAPDPQKVIADFVDFIGDDVLIGHNIGRFDISFLLRYTDLRNDYIDTLDLAKNTLDLPAHKLADICEHYGIVNEQAHRALSDVIATNKCYQLLRAEPPLEETPSKKAAKKSTCSDDTKALHTLQGLLIGVTCDGVLNEQEVITVKTWLDQNKHLSDRYPFSVASAEIQKVMKDGAIAADELDTLLNVFTSLIDPVSANSTADVSSELSGKLICLTGDFAHGTRAEVSDFLKSLGAEIHDSVTKKVNMLIVGDKGSETWLGGNYGGKIKKAMEIREKGVDITIIKESDFYRSVIGDEC